MRRLLLLVTVIATAIGGSSAFGAGAAANAEFARPGAVVLAVRADFAPPGGTVRLTVYDNAEHFLDAPMIKHKGVVNPDGVAVIPILNLAAGSYSFVAYFDANGDGKLNRGRLGRPQEPFVFSNNVRPKLRRPRFDETAVAVTPGDVVVLTLKN